MAPSCELWVSFTRSVFVSHSFFLLSFFFFSKCQLQSWIQWASPAWARVWANTTSLCGLRSVNWSQQGSKYCMNIVFQEQLWDFWGFSLCSAQTRLMFSSHHGGAWLVCSDGVSNLLAVVFPTGKDQSDWVTSFHTWGIFPWWNSRHKCWEGFPCVAHESGFFGTLETWCSSP